MVTVTGPDQHNLLLRLTGALNSLDLNVVSASISSEDGTVFDVFRITDREDGKVRLRRPWQQGSAACACTSNDQGTRHGVNLHGAVLRMRQMREEDPKLPILSLCTPCADPEERWDGVRDSVLQTLAASSSRSSKPQIFGAAPAPEPAAGSRRPIGSAAQVNRE